MLNQVSIKTKQNLENCTFNPYGIKETNHSIDVTCYIQRGLYTKPYKYEIEKIKYASLVGCVRLKGWIGDIN